MGGMGRLRRINAVLVCVGLVVAIALMCVVIQKVRSDEEHRFDSPDKRG